jgi:RNA polymerase sigma-70 factor (ECF subfamily)
MPHNDFTLLTDEQLVLISLVGIMSAYDELVRRYRGAALAVAEGALASRESAEDAVQDAFLLAFKALPQLDDPARFGSWVCVIARNRARQVGTREGRSATTEPDELDALVLKQSEEIIPHPIDELIRKIERISVRDALGNLSPDLQTVMRLYYYEEWPVKRIAEVLSLPVTTIKWRLHQGRQRMRRCLYGQMEE